MPSKTGSFRPTAGHGLGSHMADAGLTRNRSAKPNRNRNRNVTAKPKAVARRRPVTK